MPRHARNLPRLREAELLARAVRLRDILRVAGSISRIHAIHSAAPLGLLSKPADPKSRLRARGYHDVTNVDYEPRALDRGREIERGAFGNAQV